MSLITDSWPIDLLLGLILLIFTLYYYLNSGNDYWKKRNIPYTEPTAGIVNLLPIFNRKKNYQELLLEHYTRFEGERFFGYFQWTKPVLVIKDPKLIEHVLVKDFTHFEDRAKIENNDEDPLSVSLVTLRGNKWRSLRHKLAPTFTSGKLKGLFSSLCECGDFLLQTIEKHVKSGEVVDCKGLAFSFTLDVIASCAFGLEIKNEEQAKQFKEMVNKSRSNTWFGTLKIIMIFFFPQVAKILHLKLLPQDASDYFISITKQSIEHRKKNNIKRDDFFQLLLTLKEKDESKESFEPNIEKEDFDQDDIQLQYSFKPTSPDQDFKMTEEMMAGQSFVFLTAGSDTVSSTLSIVLHFLADNQHVQEKLQKEVDSVLENHGGKLTYQAAKDMVYLDQVIQESMRMFPIGHMLMRLCTSPYKIPGSDVVVEKDTSVTIPVLQILMDPKYYPEPETFDPDRFVGNNFKPSAIFSPFGYGPRICIAGRFAILEMKVFVARVMSQYSVRPTTKTKRPLRYDPNKWQSTPEGGIWVTFEKRNF